jgi:hypothetical protein
MREVEKMRPIDADEVVSILEGKQKELCPLEMYRRNAMSAGDKERFDEWQEIIDEIEGLPAVDAAPVVHGLWETEEALNGDEFYRRSVCWEEWVCIEGRPFKSGVSVSGVAPEPQKGEP